MNITYPHMYTTKATAPTASNQLLEIIDKEMVRLHELVQSVETDQDWGRIMDQREKLQQALIDALKYPYVQTVWLDPKVEGEK